MPVKQAWIAHIFNSTLNISHFGAALSSRFMHFGELNQILFVLVICIPDQPVVLSRKELANQSRFVFSEE